MFLIGGAEKAAELDAKRAIDQGMRLAAVVEDAKTGEVFNAPETLKAKVLDHFQLASSETLLFFQMRGKGGGVSEIDVRYSASATR